VIEEEQPEAAGSQSNREESQESSQLESASKFKDLEEQK